MTNDNKNNQDLESLAKSKGAYETDVYDLLSDLLQRNPISFRAWGIAAYFTKYAELREQYLTRMAEVIKKDNTPEAYLTGIHSAESAENFRLKVDLINKFKESHPAQYKDYLGTQSLMSLVARFLGF